MSEETAGEEPAERDGDGTVPAGEAAAADGGGAPQDAAEQPDPGEPRPLGVGTEPTGHDAVDAGLRRLEDADHLAVSGHTGVYEDVHRGLRDTLAALDRPSPRS